MLRDPQVLLGQLARQVRDRPFVALDLLDVITELLFVVLDVARVDKCDRVVLVGLC